MNLRAAEKRLESKFAELKAQFSKQGPYRTVVSIRGEEILLVYYATFTPLEIHAFNFLRQNNIFELWFKDIKSIMRKDFESFFNSILDGMNIVGFESKMSDDYKTQHTVIRLNKNFKNLVLNGQVSI